jgi:hypothetical protein
LASFAPHVGREASKTPPVASFLALVAADTACG